MPPDPPTPASVEALRELLAKATPGPWRVADEGYIMHSPKSKGWADPWPVRVASAFVEDAFCGSDGDAETRANAALIVAAVNALPALLAALAQPATAAGQPTNLLEQLYAGCGGSLGCQLLHQAAAEALEHLTGELNYHLEQASTYIATFMPSEKNLVSARWHINKARAAIQDTPTLTGPNDGASLYAAARAMAEHDWRDELVRDVWEELHPWEHEYYLDHARIARGGTVQPSPYIEGYFADRVKAGDRPPQDED